MKLKLLLSKAIQAKAGQLDTVGFCICGFPVYRFNQLYVQNVKKKIPKSLKTHNLNSLCAKKYLYSIYILFTTIYITLRYYK